MKGWADFSLMIEVRLREWPRADAAAIAPMLVDPDVVRWSHMAELGAERWIAEQRQEQRGPSYAVCKTDGDEVLGNVALRRLTGRAAPATRSDAITTGDHPVGELSYWVLPHARGQGVATRTMLEHTGRSEAVRSVVLDIEIDNLASIRVAELVGATRREPSRVEHDQQGIPRTLAVFIVPV